MNKLIATFVSSACVMLAVTVSGCQQSGTEPLATTEDVASEAAAIETVIKSAPQPAEDVPDEHELAQRDQGSTRRGPRTMGGMRADMTTLHAMFADRDKIERTIANLPDGAEAVTESDDEGIASLIQEHVPAMEGRVVGNEPLPPMTFHPIFVELIKRSDAYTLDYEETKKGIKVRYTSDDPYVVMLVQEHAKLVSRFIKNGMPEIHKPYTLPTFENTSGGESAATEASESE